MMALEFSQNLTKSEFFEKYSRNACQDKSHVWYFTSGFDKNSRILESYSICKNSFYRSQIQLEGTKSFISKELTKIELINANTGNYKLALQNVIFLVFDQKYVVLNVCRQNVSKH